MGFNQRLADGQPQAQSAEPCPPRLFKGVKNRRQDFCFNSTARVFNHNLELAVQIIAGSNREIAGVRREFDRILNKVPKDLLKPSRVRLEIVFGGIQFSPKHKLLFLNFGVTEFQCISEEDMSVDNLEAQLNFAFADSR